MIEAVDIYLSQGTANRGTEHSSKNIRRILFSLLVVCEKLHTDFSDCYYPLTKALFRAAHRLYRTAQQSYEDHTVLVNPNELQQRVQDLEKILATLRNFYPEMIETDFTAKPLLMQLEANFSKTSVLLVRNPALIF